MQINDIYTGLMINKTGIIIEIKSCDDVAIVNTVVSAQCMMLRLLDAVRLMQNNYLSQV